MIFNLVYFIYISTCCWHTHRVCLCLRRQSKQPQHHRAQTIHMPFSVNHCASCRKSLVDSSCFRSVWSQSSPFLVSFVVRSLQLDHFGSPFLHLHHTHTQRHKLDQDLNFLFFHRQKGEEFGLKSPTPHDFFLH